MWKSSIMMRLPFYIEICQQYIRWTRERGLEAKQARNWAERKEQMRQGVWRGKLLFCCIVIKSWSTVLWSHGLKPARLLCPYDFPGKNTVVGCHFLLQGVFLTQGSNSCLLHWQADSLPLSHLGSMVPNGIWGWGGRNRGNVLWWIYML